MQDGPQLAASLRNQVRTRASHGKAPGHHISFSRSLPWSRFHIEESAKSVITGDDLATGFHATVRPWPAQIWFRTTWACITSAEEPSRARLISHRSQKTRYLLLLGLRVFLCCILLLSQRSAHRRVPVVPARVGRGLHMAVTERATYI